MKYFIKMWPDNTATLVTDHGKTLMVFENIEEAQRALRRITTQQVPLDIHLTPATEDTIRSVA